MEFRPALIFLDIGMPGMDGYEVSRRIRRTAGLENTTLVALTGWGQEEDRRRTSEAGFNRHLVKPPKAIECILDELKNQNDSECSPHLSVAFYSLTLGSSGTFADRFTLR